MIARRHVATALIIAGLAILSLIALLIAPPHQDRTSVRKYVPTKILLPRCTGVIAHLEGTNTLRGEIHVWDYGIKHGCRVAFWRTAIACRVTKLAGSDELAAPAAIIDGQIVLPEALQDDVYLFSCQLDGATELESDIQAHQTTSQPPGAQP